MAAHAGRLLEGGAAQEWAPAQPHRAVDSYSPHIQELIMYLKARTACASRAPVRAVQAA